MRIKYLTILTLLTAPSPSVGWSGCSASTGTRRCARRWSPTGSQATWSPSPRTSSPSRSTRSRCPAGVKYLLYLLRFCFSGKSIYRTILGCKGIIFGILRTLKCVDNPGFELLTKRNEIIFTLLGSVTPSLILAEGSFMKRLCTASVSSPVACTDSLATKERILERDPMFTSKVCSCSCNESIRERSFRKLVNRLMSKVEAG